MKFYITYGSEGHPHVGGWTEVIANTDREAMRLWQAVYPEGVNRDGYLKFCAIYTEENFMETRMASCGNLGSFCWDRIELKHTVLVNDGGTNG